MLNRYVINKISDQFPSNIPKDWKFAPEIIVANYLWNFDYTPKMVANILFDNKAIYIRMQAFEPYITVKYQNFNENVFKDSCMEFFFQPLIETDGRYFNFEINPIGVPLVGLGEGRKRIRLTDIDPTIFHIEHSITVENLSRYDGKSWQIQFMIPFTFIMKYFPDFKLKPSLLCRGNFYKCGDETKFPHWGSWNPVTSAQPDFHRSQDFGELIFNE